MDAEPRVRLIAEGSLLALNSLVLPRLSASKAFSNPAHTTDPGEFFSCPKREWPASRPHRLPLVRSTSSTGAAAVKVVRSPTSGRSTLTASWVAGARPAVMTSGGERCGPAARDVLHGTPSRVATELDPRFERILSELNDCRGGRPASSGAALGDDEGFSRR